MLTIEELSDNNLTAVADLEEACFGKYAWSKELLRGEISDPNKYYIVLQEDGKVVAYGGFLHILDEGDIMNVAVAQEYRRKGYASKIFESFFSKATELGINAFTLEVRVSNLPARSLYEKKGFVNVGVRKDYYPDGEDACIYWKYM